MNRSRMLQGVLSQPKYLLDTYSGAVGAYSLRYLSSSFVGNDVVLVRRSSDDAEQGFTPDEITDGTLTSFCGVGDGFVKTWYDQTTINNVSQENGGRQPKIVDQGDVVFSNAKPSVKFDGNDDYLLSPNGFLNGHNAFSTVVFSTTVNNITNAIVHSNPSGDSANRGYDLRIPSASEILLAINVSGDGSNAVGDFNYSSGNANLITGIFNSILESNQHKLFANGSLIDQQNIDGSGIVNDGTNGGMLIGRFGTINNFGNNLNGKVSELIFFTSNKEPNRTEIESNINNYYNVF